MRQILFCAIEKEKSGNEKEKNYFYYRHIHRLVGKIKSGLRDDLDILRHKMTFTDLGGSHFLSLNEGTTCTETGELFLR